MNSLQARLDQELALRLTKVYDAFDAKEGALGVALAGGRSAVGTLATLAAVGQGVVTSSNSQLLAVHWSNVVTAMQPVVAARSHRPVDITLHLFDDTRPTVLPLGTLLTKDLGIDCVALAWLPSLSEPWTALLAFINQSGRTMYVPLGVLRAVLLPSAVASAGAGAGAGAGTSTDTDTDTDTDTGAGAVVDAAASIPIVCTSAGVYTVSLPPDVGSRLRVSALGRNLRVSPLSQPRPCFGFDVTQGEGRAFSYEGRRLTCSATPTDLWLFRGRTPPIPISDSTSLSVRMVVDSHAQATGFVLSVGSVGSLIHTGDTATFEANSRQSFFYRSALGTVNGSAGGFPSFSGGKVVFTFHFRGRQLSVLAEPQELWGRSKSCSLGDKWSLGDADHVFIMVSSRVSNKKFFLGLLFAARAPPPY
jgi:hypothetical protein